MWCCLKRKENDTMKKLLALLLAVVLCLSLAACATTPKDTATDTTPADTAADTAKDDAADNTADDSNASEPAAEGGKNIVWAGWSGEEEASKDIFQRMMKTYEDASGNTVTWVRLDLGRHRAAAPHPDAGRRAARPGAGRYRHLQHHRGRGRAGRLERDPRRGLSEGKL